jgi:uncharacterized protein YcfL
MFNAMMITILTLTIFLSVGCSSFDETKVATTISKALEIAYVSGGATLVEKKIDKLVDDKKITPEQATMLKNAAKQSYDNLQKKLIELSLDKE